MSIGEVFHPIRVLLDKQHIFGWVHPNVLGRYILHNKLQLHYILVGSSLVVDMFQVRHWEDLEKGRW